MEGGSLSRILAFDYGHGYALDAMITSEKEFTFTHHLYSVKMKMKMKIVYSVWQQCMLDSHNYNKIQTQIRR